MKALAVFIAGLLVAGAILVTHRFQIISGQTQGTVATIYRLDRLTGVTQVCFPDMSSHTIPGSIMGAKFVCEAP